MDYIIGSVFYSRCATTVRFGIRCGTPPVKWMTAVIFTPGSDTRVTTTRVRTRDRLWDSLGRVPESIAQRPLCAHRFRTHALFMSIYWLFILFTWGKTQAANKQCVFAFVVVVFFFFVRKACRNSRRSRVRRFLATLAGTRRASFLAMLSAQALKPQRWANYRAQILGKSSFIYQ